MMLSLTVFKWQRVFIWINKKENWRANLFAWCFSLFVTTRHLFLPKKNQTFNRETINRDPYQQSAIHVSLTRYIIHVFKTEKFFRAAPRTTTYGYFQVSKLPRCSTDRQRKQGMNSADQNNHCRGTQKECDSSDRRDCHMRWHLVPSNQMKIWSSHLLDNLSKNFSGNLVGCEPTTSPMPVQCSSQLSYEVTQLIAGQLVGLMFSRERNEERKKCFYEVRC